MFVVTLNVKLLPTLWYCKKSIIARMRYQGLAYTDGVLLCSGVSLTRARADSILFVGHGVHHS